jgi:hypothetical protein
MKRKFLSLVPLIAILAFAVVPAAQAITPHWYKNGVIQKAGTPLQTVNYGGQTDLSQVSKIGEIHCKGVGGGFSENPVGGGAGVGKVQSSEFYQCVAPGCEAAASEKGLKGKGEVNTENLPTPTEANGSEGWESKLFEGGTPNSVRTTIGLPWTAFPSPNQKEGTTPPGMIRATVICEFYPIKVTAIAAIFEGQLEPEIGEAASENLNGLSSAKPSVTKFAGASTGALHSEVGIEGTNSGTVKTVGYVQQEVIAVKE